jgi:hypothetical protein
LKELVVAYYKLLSQHLSGRTKESTCQDLGAGVAQSVQCLTTDWTTGVRYPTEAHDFPSSLCIQTGSGAHPASCTMSTGGKARPGRDADHSPPSSAEVKNE